MSRYAKKDIPEGWALTEFDNGKWQAYRVSNPDVASPLKTRRILAIDWIIQYLYNEQRKQQAGQK